MSFLGLLLVVTAGASPQRLWVELDVGLPGRPATAVAFSPRDPNVLLVAVDGRLFRSGDGGETFDLVFKPGPRRGGLGVDEQLALDDAAEESAEEAAEDGAALDDVPTEDTADDESDSDAVADDATDQATDDAEEEARDAMEADTGGVNTSLPDGDLDVGTDAPVLPVARLAPGIRRVVFVDGHTVLVASHVGLFRSTDGGHNFEPVPLPGGGAIKDVRDVAISPQVPTFIVAATGGGTLLSRDGGVSWVPAPGQGGATEGISCAVGPGARPAVLVGTPGGLLRSADGAAAFVPVDLTGGHAHQPVLALAVDAAQNRVYVVTSTMLYAAAPVTGVPAPVGGAWRQGLGAVMTSPHHAGQLWAGGNAGVFHAHNAGASAVELGEEAEVSEVMDVAVTATSPPLVGVATATGAAVFTSVEKAARGPNPLMLLRQLVAQEPTAAEVAEWAVDHHRMTPGVVRSMAVRGRLSWVAPDLTITAVPPSAAYRHFVVDTGRPSTASNQWRFGSGGASGLATWDLDRMLTRSEERFINREHIRLMRERERVFSKILKVYQQRRRLQADMLTRASRNRAAGVRRRLRLQQMTALLDAQTGGRFTLEARRRGAPGDGISVRLPKGADATEE